METRDTRPDESKDPRQRPDRAKYDELGRTSAAQPARPGPREQPATAVHQKRDQSAHDEPPKKSTHPADDDQDVGKGAVEE
jgi:hypothetical protein